MLGFNSVSGTASLLTTGQPDQTDWLTQDDFLHILRNIVAQYHQEARQTLCYWPLHRRPRHRLGGVVVQPRVLRQPLHGSDSDAPDPGAIETILDLQSMNLCR